MKITALHGFAVSRAFASVPRRLRGLSFAAFSAAAMMFGSSAYGAPMLQLPDSFTGVFGVDYPVIDPVFNLDEGDGSTTDYFFEWTIVTFDSNGGFVGGFNSSILGTLPLATQSFADMLFPNAGNYKLELSMATFHQTGGMAACGPHSGCFDFNTPFDSFVTTESMYVTLATVPATPTFWLAGIGLAGVISVSRRRRTRLNHV